MSDENPFEDEAADERRTERLMTAFLCMFALAAVAIAFMIYRLVILLRP